MTTETHDVHSEHYQPQVITKTAPQITADILAETRTIGPRYRTWLLITGGLFLIGIIGFSINAASKGFDSFTPWGYTMAAAAFLLTMGSSAPMLSIAQRMLRSHWRRPLSRASEMFAIVGILSTLLLIPMTFLLPPAGQRRTIWFDADLRGLPSLPLTGDLAAFFGLLLLGLALLWLGAVPDLAARRDREPNAKLAKALSFHWVGTDHQWKVLRAGLTVFGALYFMFMIWVHTIVAGDFAEALIPDFKDSLFPTWQALGGMQAAIASTLIALYIMRKRTKLAEYISLDQFWSASKIMFALSLLWGYFWFGGFLIWWYGRMPHEASILNTMQFQSYRLPFVIALLGCFLLPFLILLWNSARKSMLAPTVAAVCILVGHLFDKIRIYVSSFNVADLRADALSSLNPAPLLERPAPVWPNGIDIMIIAGAIGGGVFLYLLAIKLIPPLSIWEVSEGTLYRKLVPFMKRHILLMGKPE